MTVPPHHTFDLDLDLFDDNVTYSDTPETTFHSPAISVSPSEGPRRRVSATNQPIAFSSSLLAPIDTAYDTSVASNAFQKPSLPSTTTPGITTAATNAASAPLNLAAFGSQPWISPSVPYLHFAPQPVYEPTGELIHENTNPFHDFDNPAVVRSVSQSASSESPHAGASDLLSAPVKLDPTTAVNVFVPPAPPRSVLKRKADSLESPLSSNGNGNKLERPPTKTRSVSFERMSARSPASPDETQPAADKLSAHPRTGIAASQQSRRARQPTTSTPSKPGPNPLTQTTSNESHSHRGSFRAGTRPPSGHPPSILPPEKVFPIQIGSDLFRLSGASISSDAPSYFTQFFEEQIRQNEESGGVRTLYIDRDPETFRDVARHLQGYYVKPRDGSHFVKLFADAQFYSRESMSPLLQADQLTAMPPVPRLIDQLFESEIFIQIGERHFQIPKDIFSEPGNSPNFFSLGFAVFFSTPGEVFPGLDRRGLLRPPSITPPYVPGRSADIFAELLHLLRGYPLHIRNENHRAELLRDCRYFHLRGLEQKIIAHTITYNLARETHEITLRLEDVKPSGVSFTSDADNAAAEVHDEGGWVYYARPFVDEASYEMVVEIGCESMVLDLDDMRADFHNLTKARVSSLFQVVANKMNLPTNAPLGLMVLSGGGSGGGSTSAASPGHTPLSEDRVKVRFDLSTAIVLDGEPYEIDPKSQRGRMMLYGTSSGSDDDAIDSDNDDKDSDEDEEMTGNPKATRSTTSARQPQTTAAHRPRPGQQSRPQQHQRQQSRTISQQQAASHPPPIQVPTNPRSSSSSLSKKRKRPPIGTTSATTSRSVPTSSSTIPTPRREASGEEGAPPADDDDDAHQQQHTWLIRTAQWRLRVQPNPQDRIRGGLEIVFIGVKVEAFTGERGRNQRRGFLGGGGE